MLRWWVAGLIFLATFINILDRLTVAVLGPIITKQLGLNASEFASLTTAFHVVGTVLERAWVNGDVTSPPQHGVQTVDDPGGRQVYFGVREHAMAATMNGMALHGGVLPVGGTFLVFSDFRGPAGRMAALMELPVTFVWTHDSIGLGEDGPTHQPVEHYAALRAIPDLWFIRPGDANEAAAGWAVAPERGEANPSGPVALSRTRPQAPTPAGPPPTSSPDTATPPPSLDRDPPAEKRGLPGKTSIGDRAMICS